MEFKDPIKTALLVRSSNTLHGINAYTDNGHIIGLIWVYLASPNEWCRNTRGLRWPTEKNSYQRRIVELAGINDPSAVEICSNYAGDFIEVKLSHRRHIPAIINATLQVGLCIRMQTHLESFYTPNDAPFSLEQSERLSLRSFRKVFNEFPRILESKVWHLGDERLWKTDEGREFARLLKTQFPVQAREALEPLQLLASPIDDLTIDYPLVSATEPLLTARIVPAVESSVVREPPPEVPIAPVPETSGTLSSTAPPETSVEPPHKVPSAIATSVVVETPETCMICLDAVADTMVLPCNHVVVCQACSNGLRETHDNRICVRCRRPIEMVVWDGGQEIKC